MNIGLLLLRMTVGLTLAAHGSQKLFGWLGGYGPDGTGRFLEALGFRPGRRHAIMAGLVESGGGLLLALGFLTPVGAALGLSVMLVAAISAHLGKGFFVSSGGYEYNLILGVAALSVAFTGPGRVSVDGLAGYPLAGTVWGIGALAIAVTGSAFLLASRQPQPVANAPAAAAYSQVVTRG